MKKIKCCKCGDLIDPDEVIWADKSGAMSLAGLPWCGDCLPEQPDDWRW